MGGGGLGAGGWLRNLTSLVSISEISCRAELSSPRREKTVGVPPSPLRPHPTPVPNLYHCSLILRSWEQFWAALPLKTETRVWVKAAGDGESSRNFPVLVSITGKENRKQLGARHHSRSQSTSQPCSFLSFSPWLWRGLEALNTSSPTLDLIRQKNWCTNNYPQSIKVYIISQTHIQEELCLGLEWRNS